MKQRVTSATVLLLIFIPILIIGGSYFAYLMLVAGIFGLYELLKIVETKTELPFILKMISYVFVTFIIMNNYQKGIIDNVINYQVIASLFIVYLFPLVFINNSKKYNFHDALEIIGSILFIGIPFNLMILIRNNDLNLLIYLFLITIVTDTFAYLTGNNIGKHPLASKISAKKTIEGTIGGLLMGTIIPVLYFQEVVAIDLNLWYLIFITASLSLIGQLGDLVFSAIKRYYEQKDFSNLIPGHGGILDRLDSIIFVILFFTIIFNYL